MLKVVFDTVVFVRCLINPHSIWGRVIFVHNQKYRLVVSPPILREILEVLQRPELTQKFRSLQGLDRPRVIELLTMAEVVEIPNISAVSRDAKDDKFLATGEAARIDYLVSEDQDLLVLGEYEGFSIIDAKTFLDMLEQAEEG